MIYYWEMKTPIQVFLTCDARYLGPLSVMVLSLLKTANPQRAFRIFVAHDQSFADQGCRERIDELCRRFPFASVRFLNADSLISDKYHDVFMSELNSFSPIIWAGPLIADVLPESVNGRVVYLDVDMLVCHALDEIFDLDLGDNIAAATAENHISKSTHLLSCERPLSVQRYYNNGTMVIDLDAYRRERVSARIIDWYIRYKSCAICVDQDAQNAVLGDRILGLHVKWNYNDGYLVRLSRITPWTKAIRTHPLRQVIDATLNPCIIHYQIRKPWNFSHRPERKRYHRYMRELGIFDESLNGKGMPQKLELWLYDLYHAVLRGYVKLLARIVPAST